MKDGRNAAASSFFYPLFINRRHWAAAGGRPEPAFKRQLNGESSFESTSYIIVLNSTQLLIIDGSWLASIIPLFDAAFKLWKYWEDTQEIFQSRIQQGFATLSAHFKIWLLEFSKSMLYTWKVSLQDPWRETLDIDFEHSAAFRPVLNQNNFWVCCDFNCKR